MSEKVLLTGASGFISKHVLLSLLKQNYHVIGTVRSSQKADQVKRLMEQLGADTSRLSLEILDLNKDDGWEDVAKGCDYIQHLASPFPMKASRHREALVATARDGALRVLKAAIKTDAKRFILTASVASMMYNDQRGLDTPFSENDWSNPEWDQLSAYVISKTRAEKAVWDYAKEANYSASVTTIHPGLVLGPALDNTIGTSLEVIRQFLSWHYPMVPKVKFPIVDVRDVADLHLLAMTKDDVGTRRLLAVDQSLTLLQIGKILRQQYPKKWFLPRATMPNGFVRMIGKVHPSLKAVLPDLGRQNIANTDYVTDLTGHKFRSAHKSVQDAAQSLYDHKIL